MRGDFEALVAREAVERFAVERFAAGLRAVEARLEPAPEDFARDDVDFLAPLVRERDAADLRAVDLRAVDLRAVDLRAVDLRAVDLRAPLLRVDADDELAPEFVLADPSIDHLPDITRCAASATASAISAPSFVALDATLLAACCAVSAASSPASRIARRAFGLAAIAAAAAVNPAASISLLIAALASLSTVDLPDRVEEPEELDLEEPEVEELDLEDLEELLRAALAIAYLPPSRGKDPLAQQRFPNEAGKTRNPDMLKGTAEGEFRDALRHGQRPEMWPFVST